jgi:DNA-binding MurR/RpiR family transcriptional regulator
MGPDPGRVAVGGRSAASSDWFEQLAATRRLTPKGQKLAHFIAANPRFASFAAASELADKTEVNPATVVRLAQALGFSGWTEFQLHFRHRYLGTLLPAEVLHAHVDHGSVSALRVSLERDLENLQSALVTVDFEIAERVAATIAGARKTIVVSSGSYAAVGEVFAHLATFMGYSIELESHGGPHLVARFASLEPGDCVFAISFYRLNKHVVRATQYATERGISTVALVDSRFSPLVPAADLSLVVPSESGSFFQSMTAPLAVAYALLARMRELGGDGLEQRIQTAQQLYGELDVFYT